LSSSAYPCIPAYASLHIIASFPNFINPPSVLFGLCFV
jgi:hypothetical protein